MACTYCGYEDPFLPKVSSSRFLWYELHARFKSDDASHKQRISQLEKALLQEKQLRKDERKRFEKAQENELKKLYKQLETAQGKNDQLQKQLDAARGDNEQLNGRVHVGRNLILAMKEERSRLMAEIDNLNMINAQLLIAQITLKQRQE